MKTLKGIFENSFEYGDEVLFEEDHINLYVGDLSEIRALMTSDNHDALEMLKDNYEYGEDYEINFYADYYPYTDEVILRISPVCEDDNILKDINYAISTADKVKDNIILLSEDEIKALKEAIKDFAEYDIEEFMDSRDDI